jgi:hypothetical protein
MMETCISDVRQTLSSQSGRWPDLRPGNVDVDGQEFGKSLGIDWSTEGKTFVERTYFSRHLVCSGISTAVGPRPQLGLELQDLHLWWAEMSPEPVWLGTGPHPAAIAA